MVLLAVSEWQLVAYAASLVLVVALLVLALLRWSEGPPASSSKQAEAGRSSGRRPVPEDPSMRPTRGPPSTRTLHTRGQTVACPECALRIAAGRLHAHRREHHGTVRRCPLCNQYIRTDRILRHNLRKHGVESTEFLQRPRVPCPRCHNTVLRKNLCTHLERVHDVDIRPACGWHPIVSAMRRQRDGFWLIDGLNIVRILGKEAPRFDFLLALTYYMLQQDIDFLCVFDASGRPSVREFQGTYFAEVCEQLIRSWPQRFSEVASGNVADVAILDIATVLGSRIITNDGFSEYAGSYPWLETHSDQRISGVRLRRSRRPPRKLLVWQDVTIPVPHPRNTRAFVDQYRQLLSQRETVSSLSMSTGSRLGE